MKIKKCQKVMKTNKNRESHENEQKVMNMNTISKSY